MGETDWNQICCHICGTTTDEHGSTCSAAGLPAEWNWGGDGPCRLGKYWKTQANWWAEEFRTKRLKLMPEKE